MASYFTQAGRKIVQDLMRAVGSAPSHIGWGTGAGAASTASTGLSTEKATDLSTGTGTRTSGTAAAATTTTTDDTYQVTGTRTATGAGTVTNAGLFNNNTIASGELLMITDGLSVALGNGDSIAFTFKLQFS